MSSVGQFGKDTLHGISSMRALAAREKQRLLKEMIAVRGLLPLLMKPRNHQRWSRADRVLLRRHIKRMSMLSRYLVILLVPGGLLALPALVWWLDRRRAGARTTPR